MRMLVPVFAVLLAACAAKSAAPPDGTPYVEISNRGSIFGENITRVYQGDILYTSSHEGYPQKSRENWAAGRPGVYEEIAKLAARKGLGVAKRIKKSEFTCADYGVDRVEVVPPRGAFHLVTSDCPDPAMSAFMKEVLAVIPRDAP